MARKKKTPLTPDEYIRQFAATNRRLDAARDARIRKAGGTQQELQADLVRLTRERDFLLQEVPKLRDGGKLKEARAALKELEGVVKKLEQLRKKLRP